MSYKSRFDSLEQKAHHQIIATKISKEMSELRSLVEKSPITPKRWIWELIQNAKDVHLDKGVQIKIDYQKSLHVSFKHNGMPFTADNIRFLIEQISTKSRSKSEEGKSKTTGKFGTGFLTTHLLSEIVTVRGVAKEPDLDYRKFELELDRSSFDLEDITESVKKSKESVEGLDNVPVYSEYKEGDFNTEFIYPLQDNTSINVAEAGLTNLQICLPYTLLFVPEIESVEILSFSNLFTREKEFEKLNNEISVHTIKVSDTEGVHEIKYSMVVCSSGLTSIAIPVQKEGDYISLLPIDEEVPRLFCDFPLVGTEKFHFPTIINNPNFNPTDPRDGIYLTSPERINPQIEENKNIMKDARSLYFKLLDFAVNNNWKNIHLLAQIKSISDNYDWADNNWYMKEMVNPIREKLLHIPIVTNAEDNLISILNEEKNIHAWFPYSTNKDIRAEIWEVSHHWFPHRLPQFSYIELWYKLNWKEFGKLTIEQLAKFIESCKTLENLSGRLKGIEVVKWLNKFYELIKKDVQDYDLIINKYSIFPNQNGNFKKIAHLKNDEGDIGTDFKDILALLGNDIREELLHTSINYDFEPEDSRDKSYAVETITAEVNRKSGDRNIAKSYNEAFKKLLLWFNKDTSQAAYLFPNLFRNKHLLYDDEEIMENITKAEQLDDLLKDYNANSIEDLKDLLANTEVSKSHSSLLPVTQEILADMGISSLEEWQEALKDKNLAEIFSHESTPTTDMFFYVQGLIKKAKQAVTEHLATLDDYDLSEMDDTTAATVLAGIKKAGREISIVVRPAYFNEVIIYYGSERDILDFVDSELWIDDGEDVRRISLGHILKKSQIVKFPI
ncbi:hypothetical protein CRN76_18325 [Chryseobacterium indologenes]|uniref:sacsin N-terminal ATP-binding-like domain-containing protein n=1 Tax=Chryseobacterium indologenes TaxID=253 RepID=UPI000BFC072E|nr:hypothetical protein [Chryseobacterium indologenes]ATN07221.1 hypothetical protein CRN76_18325 [Chryseobacterium indologenes]AYY84029.1 hypothetical protein EGX91_05450 [Chryseobacterium indologenes]QIX80976.1 hypothetical protein FOB56_06900 [Chryseobacterium indologenes]UDQ54662.1 hypothetical protein LJF28_03075 [Chryseobacterium indologenes]